jgi:hypothetical protein
MPYSNLALDADLPSFALAPAPAGAFLCREPQRLDDRFEVARAPSAGNRKTVTLSKQAGEMDTP